MGIIYCRQNLYEDIADESLEALYTYFDELLESSTEIREGDVSYSVSSTSIIYYNFVLKYWHFFLFNFNRVGFLQLN